MDAEDGARLGRRQLLRLGGGLALAAAVGCTPLRPEPRADRQTAPPTERGRTSEVGASGGGARPGGTETAGPAADEATDAAPSAGDAPDGDQASDVTHRDAAAVVEVLCRDALGLSAAVAGGRAHRLRRLTLHHSALPLADNRLAPAQLRGHQRFHLAQGWSDIAYHFAVDLRGNVYELRDPTAAGDTLTAYDPGGHLGVVCEGDYDQQQPTDAMLEGAALILAHAATAYGLAPRSLSGHREHALTRCPGDHLVARLTELGDRVAELAAAGGVQRRQVCGVAGRARVEAIAQGE